MKFVTSQSAILKSLTLVLGGISKTPEHSTVKIKSENSLVTFETKNLDIKIKSFLLAQVETSGEISVELIKLLEIIKKLNTNAEILFEIKDLGLQIKNGRSKFFLKGVSSDVEMEKKLETKGSFKIMSKKLLTLIDKTKFSIYPDETRFNLNGLLFQFKEENEVFFLKSVSTDGHRLSICKIETSVPEANNFPKIIVPKKATLEIRKILESIEDEEIEIEFLEKQIGFISKSFKFISKLIDAEFPEYEKVIPLENNKIITISRKELISLVERVGAIYTNSTENGIKMHFENNLLTASAKQKDAGDSSDEITLEEAFEGSIEVNYNCNYLIEILNHITSDKIQLCLKDERTPAIIKDEKLDFYFYILMPMRL
jgi:DNA polymerase-3 subunit beta